MLRTLSDFNAAFDEGRFHSQRFLKNAGVNTSKRWVDWTFASGQPLYDAKVGTAGSFTPLVAQRNDAVYFPAIDSSMERRLSSMVVRSSTDGGPGSIIVADLVGYYPLIDGDSTDQQFFDNTLTLPRYTNGHGVISVLVSSVAPSVQDGIATMTYIGSDDVERTSPVFRYQNTTLNGLVSGVPQNSAAGEGALSLPMDGGIQGCKAITSLTYSQPPGGLAAIYMMRVLGACLFNGNKALATEKQFLNHNGLNAPRIFDGAYINLFYRYETGATADFFGELTFVWG
jgi:hypothetical protein